MFAWEGKGVQFCEIIFCIMTVWVPHVSKDFKMLVAPKTSLPGIYSKEVAARMFSRVF